MTATATATAGSKPVRLQGHMPGLDGVRGVAILMVMINHFVGDASTQTRLQRLMAKAGGYGVFGVDLFFVLSGFLITGLLLDAKEKPSYFRNFYARRTLRIFPLYYFVLAVLFLVVPHVVTPSAALERAREHQGWLWSYLTNFYIATLPESSAWTTLSYCSHFWSLAIEEHFYLFWPMVVFFQSRVALERTCVGVIVGGLALRVVLSLVGVAENPIAVLTPCRIDTLCVGALLAIYARRPGGAERLVAGCRRWALVIGGVVIAVSAWCAMTQVGLGVLHQVRRSLLAFFFGAFTLIGAGPQRGVVGGALYGRALRWLGKYSYGLYVYHGICFWLFWDIDMDARLDAALGNHWLALAARVLLGTVGSTAVAVVSYELFEKRFLALKRYFEAPKRHPEAGQRDTATNPRALDG